ncbi:MAG TPA: hypothetical protein VHK44_03320, partial [Xanthobacteraceae bacterium]|nr:hypothetical protein [Xanthobacteraceae bacterium]
MKTRRALAIAAAVAAIAGTSGYAAFLTAKPPEPQRVAARAPVWTEVKWPFPLDQWGRGRAFHCKAADCGSEVNLYLRPKIGFCNCTTGVADDEELARVGDVDLIGEASALGPGRPIGVHWMKGRSRGYAVGGHGASAKS